MACGRGRTVCVARVGGNMMTGHVTSRSHAREVIHEAAMTRSLVSEQPPNECEPHIVSLTQCVCECVCVSVCKRMCECL